MPSSYPPPIAPAQGIPRRSSLKTSGALGPPRSVTALTTSNATTSGMSLAWSPPGSGGAASSYTIQYRVSGTTSWSTAVSGLASASFAVTGLLPATSYHFEVLAVNAAGTGPASSVTTASTAAGNSVTSITWNVTPSGSYTHGDGAIEINAKSRPQQCALCSSASPHLRQHHRRRGRRETYVNTNLWGAYMRHAVRSWDMVCLGRRNGWRRAHCVSHSVFGDLNDCSTGETEHIAVLVGGGIGRPRKHCGCRRYRNRCKIWHGPSVASEIWLHRVDVRICPPARDRAPAAFEHRQRGQISATACSGVAHPPPRYPPGCQPECRSPPGSSAWPTVPSAWRSTPAAGAPGRSGRHWPADWPCAATSNRPAA